MLIKVTVHPESNQEFAWLAGEEGKADSYVPMRIGGVAEQNEVLANAYKVILNELLDGEFNDETEIASIAFDKKGQFKAVYAPQIFKSKEVEGEDPVLVTKLGKEVYPIKADLGSLNLDFDQVKIGRYKEPCLVAFKEVDEDLTIEMAFPIRLSDDSYKKFLEETSDGKKELNTRKISTLARKEQWTDLAALLKEPPSGGQYKTLKAIDLPADVEMKVLSSRLFDKGQYDPAHILLLEIPGEEDPVESFANKMFSQMLINGAEITDQTTYIVTQETGKDGKVRAKGFMRNLKTSKKRARLG